MSDDFEFRMVSLMTEYGLAVHQDGNKFFFDDIPNEEVNEALYDQITDAVLIYSNRNVIITRTGTQIILENLQKGMMG